MSGRHGNAAKGSADRRRTSQRSGRSAAPVRATWPPTTVVASPRNERGSPDEQLHPRDRGPVRAYVRDAVDSRRRLTGLLFMPAFAVALICAWGPSSDLQRALLAGSLVALAVVAVDATLLGRSITAMARAEFPGVQVSGPGTGWYVFMRAHRPRRMRIPRPRVSPGR